MCKSVKYLFVQFSIQFLVLHIRIPLRVAQKIKSSEGHHIKTKWKEIIFLSILNASLIYVLDGIAFLHSCVLY